MSDPIFHFFAVCPSRWRALALFTWCGSQAAARCRVVRCSSPSVVLLSTLCSVGPAAPRLLAIVRCPQPALSMPPLFFHAVGRAGAQQLAPSQSCSSSSPQKISFSSCRPLCNSVIMNSAPALRQCGSMQRRAGPRPRTLWGHMRIFFACHLSMARSKYDMVMYSAFLVPFSSMSSLFALCVFEIYYSVLRVSVLSHTQQGNAIHSIDS